MKLTDGAWGTELQKLGLEPGQAPDVWNLSHPERVETVARSYVEAGSEIILTNTFRANQFCVPKEMVEAINQAGVGISRQAAAGRAQVFASIGPSGKMLVTGDVTASELEAAFRLQAEALAAAGADALLVETVSDVEEGRIALRAAKGTGLPVIVSFVFDSGKKKDRTMMGQTPEMAAQAMEEEGAAGVGANCGAGIEAFVGIAQRMQAACALPIWIKANAGLPDIQGGEIRYNTTPEEFASYLPALIAAGAQYVGGCCGTSPDFIRALAARKAT